VVSTDVFGVPEVVQHGVTGSLCRSRDEDALAAELDRALAAPPGQERIRAAAQAVRTRHDADEYVERFADLIDSILAERPADDGLERPASA
jgi:glycosyltransferase involved in cell wall biosynthesis